ncbi:MAG: tyrosine-type recombinase/integrase, partial [bacterium]|nr:tyrosine-type recombinase/integrase [bacterium]
FARFAMARGDRHVIAQTAVDWATTAACEAQRHNRLMTVIRFAHFMHAEDSHHEIPPKDVFCSQRQRPTPYLFSEEEIQRLVSQAQQLGPPSTLRPHTYSTLFGLLAVTGMRASEARSLQFPDITPDGLVIRESKFKKSRLLPLHETTEEALTAYLDRRRRVAGHDPHVFVSRRGGKLSHTVVAETFHRVLQAAGIHAQPGHRSPRLTDLRHSFAVQSLLACPDERDQVSRHTLALTTYMGHAKVESTYWYLEATPELMTDIAQRCETFIYGGAL